MASYIETEDYGIYANIEALWAAHPEGGVEGAYCTIRNVKYHWDKYDRMWVADPNYGPTPARKVETFYGDVNIQNNLTVAGYIRAKGIKQPSLGLYLSEATLKAKWPDPEVGMWALVGENFPATVYVCQAEGVWTETEATGGPDDVDLSGIKVTVINDLETGGIEEALSAEQGKKLGARVSSLEAMSKPLIEDDSYGSSSLANGKLWYYASGNNYAPETPTVNPQYGCMRLAVVAGDSVSIKTKGQYEGHPWAITDTSGLILQVDDDRSTHTVDVTLSIGQDGYVYINCLTDYYEDFSVVHSHAFYAEVRETVDAMPKITRQVSSLKDVAEYDAQSLFSRWVWQNASRKVTVDKYRALNNNYGCMFLAVSKGDSVHVKSRTYVYDSQQGAGVYAAVSWAITDTERTILSAAAENDDPVETTLEIEQDGFVFINCANSYSEDFSVVHTYNKVNADVALMQEVRESLTYEPENIMLLYYGVAKRKIWNPEQLTHVLAHTYKTGKHKGYTDWFFSSLLYIEAGHDGYRFGYNVSSGGSIDKPSRKTDWEWLMGRFFSEQGVSGTAVEEDSIEGLRSLEYTVGKLKKTMGQPARRHKVVLTLPIPYYYYPTPSKNGWGTLNREDIPEWNEMWEGIFDGEDSLNFDTGSTSASNYRTLADQESRVVVMKWYIDRVIAAFNAKQYENFDLEGLYWVDETLTYPTSSGTILDPIFSSISEYIRSKGMRMYWIPYGTAAGRFDFNPADAQISFLQTGYFWKDGTISSEIMTEQVMRRLYKEAIDLYDMGLEYELSSHLFTDSTLENIDADLMTRLETITDVFEERLYFMRRNIAYYFDNDMQIKMSMSGNERVQRYMDRLAGLLT